MCSHMRFCSGFPYCQPDHGSTHYYCSSRTNAIAWSTYLLIPPSPNKLFHHLKLFSCWMPVSYSLTSLHNHSVYNILVVRIRESRNKSTCMLLYSYTMLLHSRTRTLTIRRAELHVNWLCCTHKNTGTDSTLALESVGLWVCLEVTWLFSNKRSDWLTRFPNMLTRHNQKTFKVWGLLEYCWHKGINFGLYVTVNEKRDHSAQKLIF